MAVRPQGEILQRIVGPSSDEIIVWWGLAWGAVIAIGVWVGWHLVVWWRGGGRD